MTAWSSLSPEDYLQLQDVFVSGAMVLNGLDLLRYPQRLVIAIVNVSKTKLLLQIKWCANNVNLQRALNVLSIATRTTVRSW